MKNSSPLQTLPEPCSPVMSSSPLNAGVIRSPMSGMISNPPDLLPDRVTVEWPLDKNGDPTKKLVVRKQSNVSPLEGLVFDRSMTLTGQLESGVSLAEVRPIDLRSNDPNVRAAQIESHIVREIDVYSKLQDIDHSAAPSHDESDPEPVVNQTPASSVSE